MAKSKNLDGVFDLLNKRYGKGTVGQLKNMEFPEYVRTSTGSLGLDIATGGGWPLGRMIELFGWESSGKTTICKQAIAEFQKKFPDRPCAFIDTEHAFDRAYATSLGVNVDNLIVNQPSYGEEAFDVALELVRSGQVGLVIFDSIASARPRRMIEGDIGDQNIGLHARLVSDVAPRLASACSENNTTMLLTNQLRHKIGVMFGSPEVTTAGNAMKFYASLRVQQTKFEAKDKRVTDGDEILGSLFRSKVVKNKTAPPFKEAEYDILYGEGVDLLGEIVDYGVACGVLEKKGAWYSFKESNIGQGRKQTIDFLRDNEEFTQECLTSIKEAYGLV